MDFYLINSLDDLKEGTFGVREPDTSKCKKLTDYSNSLIIVPGICFDESGCRIGYGKGYYDIFLKKYPFISVGLCYNSFVLEELPANEHDENVNIIVTDKRIIKIGGKNG